MEDARKAVDDNLKEDGPLAMKHLNTVVTKLSVFVGVIDVAADVSSSCSSLMQKKRWFSCADALP